MKSILTFQPLRYIEADSFTVCWFLREIDMIRRSFSSPKHQEGHKQHVNLTTRHKTKPQHETASRARYKVRKLTNRPRRSNEMAPLVQSRATPNADSPSERPLCRPRSGNAICTSLTVDAPNLPAPCSGDGQWSSPPAMPVDLR